MPSCREKKKKGKKKGGKKKRKKLSCYSLHSVTNVIKWETKPKQNMSCILWRSSKKKLSFGYRTCFVSEVYYPGIFKQHSF